MSDSPYQSGGNPSHNFVRHRFSFFTIVIQKSDFDQFMIIQGRFNRDDDPSRETGFAYMNHRIKGIGFAPENPPLRSV